MTKPKKKAIATLFKECSFVDLERDPNGKLVCRRPATSGVVMPNTEPMVLLWRCPDHQGQLSVGVEGPVRYQVVVRDE